MFNQCRRRVPRPNPKQLPKALPNSPSERGERWSLLPDEFTPALQGKTSVSTKQAPSSIHSEDSGKRRCEQELSNAKPSPKSCATSQSSLPSPQPLDRGLFLSRLDKWQNNVSQAELRVALRYSMGLLIMQALSRRSAFSDIEDESLNG